jgi:membrane protease YdiL (CAAX protease family)
MELRCNACGARVFEGADWCTQCYAPAPDPATVAPAAVPPVPAPPPPPPTPVPIGAAARAAGVAGHVGAPSPLPGGLAYRGGVTPPPGPASPTPAAHAPPAWPPPPAPQAPPAWPPPPAPQAPPAWPPPVPPAAPAWPPTTAPSAAWSAAAPAAPNAWAPPRPGEWNGPFPPVTAEEPTDRSVLITAIVVIAVGAASTLGTYIWGRTSGAAPTTIIRDSLLLDVAFYVLVALVALRRAQRVEFRPVWTEGNATDSLVWGLFLGLGVGMGLLLLTTLANGGRLSSDQSVTLIVSDKSIWRIGLAVLVACIAAPWVEELLFRGLVAESLRPRGTRAAIQTSAVLFALWHPQALFPLLDVFLGHGSFLPFLYYVGMGSIFGKLYFKRGMKATIAAHTAFNGVLVLAAVVSVSGIAQNVGDHGVTTRIPGNWRQADTSAVPVPSDTGRPGVLSDAQTDLALEGPSGAAVIVEHQDVLVALSTTADGFDQSVIDRSQNDTSLGTPSSPAHEVVYPMGKGVRVDVVHNHVPVVYLFVPAGNRIWTVVGQSGGSTSAQKDIEDILMHLQLPQ